MSKGIELAKRNIANCKQVIATNKALIECYESNEDYASVVQAMIRIEAWEGHLEQAESQLAKCLRPSQEEWEQNSDDAGMPLDCRGWN